MSLDHLLPSLDDVRLGIPADLPRIATVAAAGFFWSPSFQFQRPFYADYPEDTLSSYWREYQAAIEDPASIVLVCEAKWDSDEVERVYGALRRSPMYKSGTESQTKIIVGICSINLKPGSPHIGLFQTASHVDGSGTSAALSSSRRDQSIEAVQLYNEMTAPFKKKYLAGQMKLSTLAVHPAYWRRGYATRLVNWCTRLADMEDARVGVSAAPKGAMIAAKAGFEQRETVRIQRSAKPRVPLPRNTPNVGDVELWIAVREPSRSSPGASPASPVRESQ